jgi:hypothetical protein
MIRPTASSIHRLYLLVGVVAIAAPIVLAETSGWYLGLAGQSCAQVCLTESGLSCNADSVTQQELVIAASNIVYVSTHLVDGQSSCTSFAPGAITTSPSQAAGANGGGCTFLPATGTSTCTAADTSINPVARRYCCCLANGADASTVCQVFEAPSAAPSDVPSSIPTTSAKPSRKPSRMPSAKPSMMPSLWKETCPGAFIPVLGRLMKLLCLLVKLIKLTLF